MKCNMISIIKPQYAKNSLLTKLGKIEYTNQDLFTFKQGLYGFEDFNEYIVTLLPSPEIPDVYRYLQSLEEPGLAFIIMNATPFGDSLINKNDLTEHLKKYKLNIEEIAIYLVTSIRSEYGRKRVSVNTKAPVILSQKKQEGRQIILENPNYQVINYLV